VIVIGPYLRMRRGGAEAQREDHVSDHTLRDVEARLEEAKGLARAIDLEVVDAVIALVGAISASATVRSMARARPTASSSRASEPRMA